MSWHFHVKDKAMDAVLDEGPQEPAHQKEQWESVLMDQDVGIWKHTYTHENYDIYVYIYYVYGCAGSENEIVWESLVNVYSSCKHVCYPK